MKAILVSVFRMVAQFEYRNTASWRVGKIKSDRRNP